MPGKSAKICLYNRQKAGGLHFIKQHPAGSVNFADDFLPFFPCQKVFLRCGVGRNIYGKLHHDPAVTEGDIAGVPRYPCLIADIAVLGSADKGKCGWLVVYFVPCSRTFPWRYAAIVSFLFKTFIKVVNIALGDCIDILQRDFYHTHGRIIFLWGQDKPYTAQDKQTKGKGERQINIQGRLVVVSAGNPYRKEQEGRRQNQNHAYDTGEKAFSFYPFVTYFWYGVPVAVSVVFHDNLHSALSCGGRSVCIYFNTGAFIIPCLICIFWQKIRG